MEFIISALGIIAGILAMGLLVFVHEMGHLLMAKMTGIAVEAFSLGFGKELWGFDWGGTRYRISMIPFGGYCKMRGEETADRETLEKEGRTGDPQAMYNRPAWARLLAVIGGPLFNYILAILIFTALFLFGYNETRTSARVAVLEQYNGNTMPAWQAGLRTGDTIIRIGSAPIRSFEEIPLEVALATDETIDMTYTRDGVTNSTRITPRYDRGKGMGMIGVSPMYDTTVWGLDTNAPAYLSNWQLGDKIVSVNGRAVIYAHEIEPLTASLALSNVRFTLSRKGTNLDSVLTLDRFDAKGYSGARIGNAPTFVITNRAPHFFAAWAMGFNACNDNLARNWKGLRFLVRNMGREGMNKNVSGPVGIVTMAGKVATKTDIATFLQFLALLSVGLALFNILPLPGLDGGHVVFNLIEWVTRRRIPEKIRGVVEYAGLIFLIGLSVLVLFNDVFNIARGVTGK